MRVLHLSTFDIQGGAARGAYSLHRSLSERGVDSRMLVSRKFSDDPTVVEPPHLLLRLSNAVRSRLDAMPLRNYRKTADSYWTIGWVPTRIERIVDAYEPDIVHIHWTGGGFMSVDSLRRLPYPIVWTLRDMWALTGGCHYSAGCERFAEACGRCPQLRSDDANDISHRMWTRKRDAWKGTDLWVVPISTWLAECARRSAVFDHMPINVIPNGIDTTRFRPSDTDAAKAAWGLSPDKLHILFGAVDATTDPRKGFQHLRDAIRQMGDNGWSERIELVVFGGTAPDEASSLGVPVRSVGKVDDDDLLAKLYSACDVMVVPSTQEAFGKTLVEAMACGTPVVAFASGGPVDIVEHQRTGYLAESFSAEALAAGITWCIENDERKHILGEHARARAEHTFEIGVVAESYKTLYRQILARAP